MTQWKQRPSDVTAEIENDTRYMRSVAIVMKNVVHFRHPHSESSWVHHHDNSVYSCAFEITTTATEMLNNSPWFVLQARSEVVDGGFGRLSASHRQLQRQRRRE